jgi:ABC-type Fe3+ transport system substrate-binding protein
MIDSRWALFKVASWENFWGGKVELRYLNAIHLEPAITQVNPVMLAAKAPRPNAARLFYDFVLSKEGQEMLRGFQRIPVRKDVDPDPPRLFRGFKIAIEDPEDYRDFDGSVKQYLDIFKLR